MEDDKVTPARRASRRPRTRGGNSTTALINTVLVGVGAVYLGTSSIPVTAIAAAAAVLLVTVITLVRR